MTFVLPVRSHARALACLALGAILFPTALVAQDAIPLRAIPTARGEVALGQGGLSGGQPIVGSLGAATAALDLDGDGLDDYVLGAPDLPGNPSTGVLNEAGHVYVIFGEPDGGLVGDDPDLDLRTLVTGQGLDIRGLFGDRVGNSLAAVGDIDGDGLDDLLIGAEAHDASGRQDSGAAYILWGDANLSALSVTQDFPTLVATGQATRLVGAHAFGLTGAAVGGGVDVDNNGRPDLLIGSPLASTNGLTQNGTASVVYGGAGLKVAGEIDLGALGAGAITEVSGALDFQLMGSSVAGLGAFDPVLPGTGGLEDLVNGDDVALGAPGTLVNGGLFTGAAYVLRGQTSGPLPLALTSDDFVGGDSAGLAYPGDKAGDQAGFYVGTTGDLAGMGDGFVELLVGAPFSDGPGRPDCGAFYYVPGRFGGVNPVGFSLGSIGPGDSLDAIQIFGASNGDGQGGLTATSSGDFDLDGVPEVVLGYPRGAAIDDNGSVPDAGVTRWLDGASLVDPTLFSTIDFALDASFVQLFRVQGEVSGARGGAAVASGDVNGDGEMDVIVGAPGAPSDPSPADPNGFAASRTGRGHVIYGPMSRIASITPTESHFQGPPLEITIYQLFNAPFTVTIDGMPAMASSGQPGKPGTLTVPPPVPLMPGTEYPVDVAVTVSTGFGAVTDAFTYIPLSILTGPTPSNAFEGQDVAFTGTGISGPSDMDVTIGGVPATVSLFDTTNGTFSVTVPAGLPQGVPLDIDITSSNGSAMLSGALMIADFSVADLSPISGPQTSGIEIPPTMGFSYLGQPVVPVTMNVSVPSGTIPADTTVEFGNDTIGYKQAVITSIVDPVITVELPYFLLGDMTVPVNVRITNARGVVILEDGFTYDPSDFTHISGTEKAGFGGIPESLAAGDYMPSGRCLIVFQGHPPTETEFGLAIAGFELFDPLLPFFGGLLGPMPTILRMLPLDMTDQFAFQLNHSPDLGPEGLNVYIQLVVQENDGMTMEWSSSEILVLTVNFP